MFSKYLEKENMVFRAVYSKDQATDFYNNVVCTNYFKSFKFTAKLLENIKADGVNGILKTQQHCAIKRSKSFLEIIRNAINYMQSGVVDQHLKWTNHCILFENDNDDDAYSNNIIFTIKDTKLYVPAATLLKKDNQKLSKVLSKGSERSVYWKEYKTKSEMKKTTNEYRSFLKLNFVEVDRLFVLIYQNQDAKRFKARVY